MTDRLASLCAAMAATLVAPALIAARPLGSDSAACGSNDGSAIEATIVGLKVRKGRVKLELYPANDEDFLKDDRDLVAQGKFFRRIWADLPGDGPVSICIKAPHPGHYAMLFTHDRDGKNKFNFWTDGAGFIGNGKLGRSRPKLAMAAIDVGNQVTHVTIRAQYLRGFSGFGPLKPAQ